jgi:hypothetical protein
MSNMPSEPVDEFWDAVGATWAKLQCGRCAGVTPWRITGNPSGYAFDCACTVCGQFGIWPKELWKIMVENDLDDVGVARLMLKDRL